MIWGYPYFWKHPYHTNNYKLIDKSKEHIHDQWHFLVHIWWLGPLHRNNNLSQKHTSKTFLHNTGYCIFESLQVEWHATTLYCLWGSALEGHATSPERLSAGKSPGESGSLKIFLTTVNNQVTANFLTQNFVTISTFDSANCQFQATTNSP